MSGQNDTDFVRGLPKRTFATLDELRDWVKELERYTLGDDPLLDD